LHTDLLSGNTKKNGAIAQLQPKKRLNTGFQRSHIRDMYGYA
jgi:hypothetical protein